MKIVIIHWMLAFTLIFFYVTGDLLEVKNKTKHHHNKNAKNSITTSVKHKHKKDIPLKVHGISTTKTTSSLIVFFLASIVLIASSAYTAVRLKKHISWFKNHKKLLAKFFAFMNILYFIDTIILALSGIFWGYLWFYHGIFNSPFLAIHKITAHIFLNLTFIHLAYAGYYLIVKKNKLMKRMIFIKK